MISLRFINSVLNYAHPIHDVRAEMKWKKNEKQQQKHITTVYQTQPQKTRMCEAAAEKERERERKEHEKSPQKWT